MCLRPSGLLLALSTERLRPHQAASSDGAGLVPPPRDPSALRLCPRGRALGATSGGGAGHTPTGRRGACPWQGAACAGSWPRIFAPRWPKHPAEGAATAAMEQRLWPQAAALQPSSRGPCVHRLQRQNEYAGSTAQKQPPLPPRQAEPRQQKERRTVVERLACRGLAPVHSRHLRRAPRHDAPQTTKATTSKGTPWRGDFSRGEVSPSRPLPGTRAHLPQATAEGAHRLTASQEQRCHPPPTKCYSPLCSPSNGSRPPTTHRFVHH